MATVAPYAVSSRRKAQIVALGNQREQIIVALKVVMCPTRQSENFPNIQLL